MANLTGANLETLMLQDLQSNVTTDPPVSTAASAGSVASAETYAFLNDAYSQLWDLWGGSNKAATSATLWTPAQSADTTGILTGVLATIAEIRRLWATTTSSSTGGGANDILLDRVPLPQIHALRASSGIPSYTTPKMYAVSTLATTTAANVNLLQLDYWPGVTGYYFPAHYLPMFTPLAATSDVPDLPDLAQRDMAHLAAYTVAPLIDRPDLAAGIFQKLSEKTQLLLNRKRTQMSDARQGQ